MDFETDLDPDVIDVPTLAVLAGTAANEYLLLQLREGHPGIRISHGYVFQHLLRGIPTIGELAERLGVTQQAASKTVLELESLGYVARVEDEADSRVRRVALTAEGRALIASSRAARTRLQRELGKAVGERALSATRRTLVALLERTGGLSAVSARDVKPPAR